MLAASLLTFIGPVHAQIFGFGVEEMALADLKSNQVPAAPAPAPEAVTMTRDQKLAETRRFLASTRSTSKENDTAARFSDDTELAITAFEYCFGRPVSYADSQEFASGDFWQRTGTAQFNPNMTQTSRIGQALDALMPSNPSQAQLIFEGLVGTKGNVPLAMGSLAELFCEKRNEYLPHVRDMAFSDGKNYYRFAGMFIGLHPALIRMAGKTGAQANILGNPIVYAGKEVFDWWAEFLTTGKNSGINTLETMGPNGNGNLIDKLPELDKGLEASTKLRRSRNITF